MHKLILRNADGSIYWTEVFNSRAELDKWLEIEKTRKYWKLEFAIEILDQTPVKDPAEEAKQVAEEKDRKDRRSRLKSVDWDKIKSVDDLKSVLKDLVDNT